MIELQGIKLYDIEEIAEMLKVTTRTIHNYIKAEKLKGQQIGGKWLISEENLKNFLNGK